MSALRDIRGRAIELNIRGSISIESQLPDVALRAHPGYGRTQAGRRGRARAGRREWQRNTRPGALAGGRSREEEEEEEAAKKAAK